MTKLVYIGGYGRSGSTLLDSLLATHPDLLACGKVTSCLRQRLDLGLLAEDLDKDCDVWVAIYEKPERLRRLDHEVLASALLDRAEWYAIQGVNAGRPRAGLGKVTQSLGIPRCVI